MRRLATLAAAALLAFSATGAGAQEYPTKPKLHDAFKKAMEEPSVLEVMDRHQMVPNYKNAADYTKYIGEQVKFEGDLLKRLGLAKTE